MAKKNFRIEPRGEQWAAIDPEGQQLASFSSEKEALEYAGAYRDVYNLIAQDTGQAVRFGTAKAQSPDQRRERVHSMVDKAARQFVAAGQDDASLGSPADAPAQKGLTNATHAPERKLVEQAAAPAPKLPAAEEVPDAPEPRRPKQAAAPPPRPAQEAAGLNEGDVRRLIQQETRPARGRRSVAAAAEAEPIIPPAEKPEGESRERPTHERRLVEHAAAPRPRPAQEAAGLSEGDVRRLIQQGDAAGARQTQRGGSGPGTGDDSGAASQERTRP